MLKRIKKFFTKRRVMILSVCLVVFVMSLGYAALSQYIELDGIASIDRSWIVKITNVTNTVTNSAESTSSNYVGSTVTLNANLPTSTSTVTYTITLSNQGNIPAKLNTIDVIEDENTNITYEISGVVEGVTQLNPGETNTATVTIKYKSGVTNIGDTEKSIMFTFNYIENSGTIGGDSGDSTSDTENVVYYPGDIVEYDGGQGKEKWIVITGNDTITNDTIKLMRVTGVTGGSTITDYNNTLSHYKTLYSSGLRYPTTSEILALIGKNISYGETVTEIPEYLYNFLGNNEYYYVTGLSGGGSGEYYVVTSDGKLTAFPTLAGVSHEAHFVLEVDKDSLGKYQRYEIGDQVTLVDGSKWTVTKDSGTGSATVTLVSNYLLASNGTISTTTVPNAYKRAFDYDVTYIYNKFGTSNIGYLIENEFLPQLKTSLEVEGADTSYLTGRLLTREEFSNLANKREEKGSSWYSNYYDFWVMPESGETYCSIGAYAISKCDTYNYASGIKPVITILKSNIKKVYLKDQILEDNVEQVDSSIDFSQISSSTNGQGLYYTNTNTENNQRTYYFRGNVTNNYVYFANFYWRIIRINEDGSVRLIYQGETADATGSAATIGNSYFNSNYNDNAYVGYMYGYPESSTIYGDVNGDGDVTSADYLLISRFVQGVATPTDEQKVLADVNMDGVITSDDSDILRANMSGTNDDLLQEASDDARYDATHKNLNDSTIKGILDTWYEENLIDYSSYLSDSGFCGDRSTTDLGYGINHTYYGAYNRLYTNKTPQFACPQSNDLYTTSSSNKGNKALDYPIGLITADEVAYAGGVYSVPNSSYYLYTGDSYWTMSPGYFGGVSVYEWLVDSDGHLRNLYVNYSRGARPVINLVSGIEITGGDGTSSNPYVIKTT